MTFLGFARKSAMRKPLDDAPALIVEEIKEAFEKYRARLVVAGLELYREGEGNDAVLWAHFMEARADGKRTAEIGPPTKSAPTLLSQWACRPSRSAQ